jgi:hypothetical protein
MYFHKHTIQITASTDGGAASYSTVLSGLIYSIRYEAGTLALSTARTLTIGRESSADIISKFAVPSSNCNRYPRWPVHGSTGNELKSTDFREMFPLCRERIKVSVNESTSPDKISGSLTVYLGGD